MPLHSDDKITRYENARERANVRVAGSLTPYTIDLVNDAISAIGYLMQHGGFTPLTKDQFAVKMDWVSDDLKPNRRLVESVCNLSRDVEDTPDGYPDWVVAQLGGYVIAYAPSDGGMCLLGEGVDIDARMFVHLITGDLQKQQAMKTMMRRRLPMYKKVVQAFADAGQWGLAKALAKGENEVETAGMVSDHVVGEVFKAAREIGVIES